VCGQRKGKRPCPAKESLICAQCCGEKRILEIDCPENCEFLQAGRSREAHHQRTRHFRPSDPAMVPRFQRIVTEFQDFLASLEYLFAEERHSSKELKDDDVAQALDLVLETLRTEQKGILYEHTSNDLRIENLRRQIRDLVAANRNPQQSRQQRYAIARPDEQMIKLSDAVECLELIRDVVESHRIARPSALSYVDFLARLMPRRRALQDTGPSIVVPGR
jgi:hypothetical protein